MSFADQDIEDHHHQGHLAMPSVLLLDVCGNPVKWAGVEEAAGHVATHRVAWSLGREESVLVLHGGMNAASGEQSVLRVPTIIAIKGSEAYGRHLQLSQELSARSNVMLFRRDRNVCAYCGEACDPKRLTRDHVVPRCMGGADTWTNCVTACRRCNAAKGSLPVERFRPLLYVPYVPCRSESFILARRNILADQMEFLASKLPRHSRARLC